MRSTAVVVIGASAGGIEALRLVASMLPRDFPAPICVVVHTSPQAPGVLDAILTRAGALTATNAVNGERLQPGRIYVAPPDLHLVIEPGVVRLSAGPREHGFRPAINPLFRSAAQVFGPAAIGVILTGSLDDGTDGLWAIGQLGGRTLVQDPRDARYPSMPQSALDRVHVEFVVPLVEIGPTLVRLTAASMDAPVEIPSPIQLEPKIAMTRNSVPAGVELTEKPSPFACPECQAVLFELTEESRSRFRCRAGHAYSIERLVAAIGQSLEASARHASRALEEGELLVMQGAPHSEAHRTHR